MNEFKEMGLSNLLLEAIEEMGFEEPTPIQKKTIPFLVNKNQDLIGLAQTGTGKTAAFGLPIINDIQPKKKPQVLVLCPTRELCLQISKDFESYTKYIEDVKVTAVYGGTDIKGQIKELKENPQIIAGTPGRVLDLINRNKLDLTEIDRLVLDEADEMLSMGFKEELDAIFEQMPEGKQTLLFSATMPSDIQRIANKYMHSPEEISVGKKNEGAENVQHQYCMVGSRDRFYALKRLVDYNPGIYALVFCRTKNETREVADQLIQEGYQTEALNGDLSQAQRDRVMNLFREQHVKILVATDVAARGLDVNNLTHVINYNLPEDPEVYIHRSGRTGRAGKEGTSLSLITAKEKGQMKSVEKILGKPIDYVKVPSPETIAQRQIEYFLYQVKEENEPQDWLSNFESLSDELMDLPKETLVNKFLSVSFNQLLNSYQDARDLNAKPRKVNEKDTGAGRSKPKKNGYTKLFLNVGKEHELTKKDLIDMVNKQFPKEKVDIGTIKVLDRISFFEIDDRYHEPLLEAFKSSKKDFNGRSLNIELAKDS